MDQLCERMKAAAREIAAQDEFGALHIFVADGNCEDEHLQFCLDLPEITEAEREFAQRMLDQFSEEQRFGAWALSYCADATAIENGEHLKG